MTSVGTHSKVPGAFNTFTLSRYAGCSSVDACDQASNKSGLSTTTSVAAES